LSKATPKRDRAEKYLPKKGREEEKENRRSEIMRVLGETNGRVGGADGAAAPHGHQSHHPALTDEKARNTFERV
jgi:hypothetical protein